MNCKEVTEFLDDYLDGTMPWRQRLLFNLHLFLCRRCRQYLASYAATIRVTKSLGLPDAERVPAELVRAILAARRSQQDTQDKRRMPKSKEE